MFPGFATIYKDNLNNVHLYVYTGIDDDGKQIYRNIDLNNIKTEYTFIQNKDKSYDFTFKSKINKIICSMINIKTGIPKKFEFSL